MHNSSMDPKTPDKRSASQALALTNFSMDERSALALIGSSADTKALDVVQREAQLMLSRDEQQRKRREDREKHHHKQIWNKDSHGGPYYKVILDCMTTDL